ncbi:MAG TPA: NADH:flavin oxidoreductase/NADH oxidase [Usitatibacter sp.]|jgi:2,4-dienoyl-CoA reductase-like NADH-dependent reductase (Old Yellow Enzyme family)|nr:NADH:flavin oxidoreductase/NADH oxidase [Usitatibacter sp.]
MSRLFSPLVLRSIEFPHRVFVSPMCQYSSEDGFPNDWHLVHLGSRAVGGAALVCVEASGVTPEGRITPWDAGIWSEAHARAWKPIADFLRAQGAVPGIQLAHAGRKASCDKPWNGGRSLDRAHGGWETLGPSALAFGEYAVPRAMTTDEIRATVDAFARAAGHALAAGFDVVEVHGAHGYLLHEFVSPISNRRTDAYGGAYDNRVRFALEVARAVRDAWPADKPVLYRISATDWVDGGWDLAQSIELARRLKAIGIDLVDCSSGGNVHHAKIPLGPGYQVPFAEAIRREARIPTAAVGLISDAVQAEQLVALGQADAVFLARAMLRDPYWPRHAAKSLKVEMPWPDQYKRCDVGPMG